MFDLGNNYLKLLHFLCEAVYCIERREMVVGVLDFVSIEGIIYEVELLI